MNERPIPSYKPNHLNRGQYISFKLSGKVLIIFEVTYYILNPHNLVEFINYY